MKTEIPIDIGRSLYYSIFGKRFLNENENKRQNEDKFESLLSNLLIGAVPQENLAVRTGISLKVNFQTYLLRQYRKRILRYARV